MAARTKGLGKGLDSMFAMKSVADVLTPQKVEAKKSQVAISKLKPGRYQARVAMPEEKLQELAASIREKGILNPIAVRKSGGGEYEILAGERRFRAAQLVGLKEVPVTVLEADDRAALTIGLIENLQREDLNAMEAANGVERLVSEFRYSHEQAAQALGCSRSQVTNLLRLLTLDTEVQAMLRAGQLSMGHARALLPLARSEQLEVANKVVARALSVRQTEQLVAQLKNPTEPESDQAENKRTQKLEKQLQKRFNQPVKISISANGRGRIQIPFGSEEELEKLLEMLRG